MADERAEIDRVWKMMGDIPICMLATRDGDLIRSRPMGAYVRPEEDAIYFLTDARAHKEEEIEQYPHVCLIFADAHSHSYVSLAGRATVSNDRGKIAELWGIEAKTLWDGPDDPEIRLLTVRPIDAQYWGGSGAMVSYVKMIAAALSGSRPDLGERRKVAM